MRQMHAHSTLVILALAAVLVPATVAYAWNPVAHYIMAQELNLDPLYANLPDAWPSHSGTAISEKFCWSHALQDSGYNGIVPLVPIYPEDGRWPEYDMRILAKYKLKNPSPTANKTVEGFAAHNATDKVVHYAYFEGGTSALWLSHSRKEKWADYVIFAWKKANATFDANGEFVDASVVFGEDGNVLPALVFRTDVTGDAVLLRLAQKVYRKNGRKTDADGTGELDVDTVATITGLFTQYNNDYGETVGTFLQNDRLGRDDSWEEMHGYAVSYGWAVHDCMTTYNTAKTRAQARLDFVRGM